MNVRKENYAVLLVVLVVSLLAALLSGIAESAEGNKKRKAEEGLFKTMTVDFAKPADVLGWIDSREMISLNGDWAFIVDPMAVGAPGSFGDYTALKRNDDGMTLAEYDFATADRIHVPGDFNSQQERLFFYQGWVWYYKEIEKPALTKDQRLHLWFGGANFTTQLYLNGKPLGQQVGGYVPFSFDVTERLQKGKNTLLIRLSNKLDENSVPTWRTDWWPYGGLIRDVALVKTPTSFIRNAQVQLDSKDNNTLQAKVQVAGGKVGEKVSVSISALGVSEQLVIDADGFARGTISARPTMWEPANPVLYDVEVAFRDDKLSDKIGFRRIEVRGQQILLNGEPIKFKGISTHEEPIGDAGVMYSAEQVEKLLVEAKQLGVNFVRAAHYPYSRYMAKVADRVGIMLWEEVPVYWNIAWNNPETLDVARDQLRRLVQRDWNRASVVVWSVANETPYSEPRMAFLGQLIDDARAMDGTRLVSAALLGGIQAFDIIASHLAARVAVAPDVDERGKQQAKGYLKKLGDTAPAAEDKYVHVIDDPLGELADIVSYNEYFGWYYCAFLSKKMGVDERYLRQVIFDQMANTTITSVFDKPIHISEFGAGAKAGKTGKGANLWSEEYQAKVYRAQTDMLARSAQVQGMTPWILKDFRAMLRPLAGIQDYYNRKGLISPDGERKQAYYVLKDFYDNQW